MLWYLVLGQISIKNKALALAVKRYWQLAKNPSKTEYFLYPQPSVDNTSLVPNNSQYHAQLSLQPSKTRSAFGSADLNADLSTFWVGKFLPTLI